MIIKVNIENHIFEIDCDTGTQDIAWLCLSACYLFGKDAFPITTYLPILAKNKKGEILHPKLIIIKSQKIIGAEINVKVKKKFGTIGSEMTQEEKDWFNDAFEEGRFMNTLVYTFKPGQEIRRDNKFRLEFAFKINEDVKLYFPNYTEQIFLDVVAKTKRNDVFEGRIKVPFGKLIPVKIHYCNKDSNEYDKNTEDFVKNDITFNKYPETLSLEEKEKFLREKEEAIRDKEIKIKENILNAEKEKKEEEERFIKLKEDLSQIPFTLEDVYNYVREQIDMSEQDLVEIFELLERNGYAVYRTLFDIFFNYCKFYANNENLTVDAVSVINFLNLFYRNRENTYNLAEEFQALYLSRLEKDSNEIDFREFIYILIFLLNSLLTHKDINLIQEIEQIQGTYEELLKNKAYRELNKNDLVIEILNNNYTLLRNIFDKYGIHTDKTDTVEMSSIQFMNFINDLAKKNKYDFTKISKGDVLVDSHLDFFDFLKRLVAISINLLDESLGEREKIEIELEKLINNIKNL
jgi:hypothetical protein